MRGKLKRGRRKCDVREMERETEILNLRRQEAEEGKHHGKVGGGKNKNGKIKM